MKLNKAKLPTKYGSAYIYWFSDVLHNKEHCCLVFWELDNKDNVLCRIHSSCITWDVFQSLKCDCGEQLDFALKEISKNDGILIYLNQEGRDIGLINKIQAYALQDEWYDTVEANEKLNLPIDNRDYQIVKEILDQLKVKSIKLMTNNPHKINQLENYWIKINEIIPIVVNSNIHNVNYLSTKKEKMKHYL